MSKASNIQKNTVKKFLVMSKNLTKLRTKLIIMKYRIEKYPEPLDKFIAQQEFEFLDKVVHDAEMEYDMLKFVWFNVER